MTELTPPDPERCQAEKPNGATFMTVGGRPELVRCTNKPTLLATEKEAGDDGQRGSMTLCQECADVMKKQMPGAATISPLGVVGSLKDPFVFKVLDVSTGHMTRSDARWLQSHDDLSAYELGEYGWLCYVGEIEDNWGNFSWEFRTIMNRAKDLGCDYVRFDRDGREYDEFKSFDW